MSAAHDFDRTDNDAIAAGGRYWMIPSKVSTGSEESIVQECGWGQDHMYGRHDCTHAPPERTDATRPDALILLQPGRRRLPVSLQGARSPQFSSGSGIW